MSLEQLTLLSTSCIVLSGLSLLAGWWCIRARDDVVLHRNAMLAASTFAALFLVFYVTRWALHGSKPFGGTGWLRVVYFSNLVPHVILAIVLAPLAVRLIWLALVRQDFVRHRRLARVTLPIWLYVAASGWLVYWMLYRLGV
jgi:putative membrane protein